MSKPIPQTIQSPPDNPDEVTHKPVKFIPKRVVLNKLGDVTYPTLWDWINRGRFPRPIQMGGRSMWLEHEVEAFMLSLPRRPMKNVRG